MAQQVRVPFGTTAEELKSAILETCRQNNWDPARVCFIIDLKACTVKDTVYAVSNRPSDLPAHPDGSKAVQRLS